MMADVEYRGSWTWIRFSSAPDETVRSRLMQAGGVFTGKRMAWFFKRHVGCAELVDMGVIGSDDERCNDSGEIL